MKRLTDRLRWLANDPALRLLLLVVLIVVGIRGCLHRSGGVGVDVTETTKMNV